MENNGKQLAKKIILLAMSIMLIVALAFAYFGMQSYYESEYHSGYSYYSYSLGRYIYGEGYYTTEYYEGYKIIGFKLLSFQYDLMCDLMGSSDLAWLGYMLTVFIVFQIIAGIILTIVNAFSLTNNKKSANGILTIIFSLLFSFIYFIGGFVTALVWNINCGTTVYYTLNWILLVVEVALTIAYIILAKLTKSTEKGNNNTQAVAPTYKVQKYCKNCGCELAEGQAICTKCGFAVGNGKKYCGNCGEEIQDEGQAICIKCGFALSGKTVKFGGNLNGQNKMTMALVCFFLGGIGIHNFMMGESKKGVFKIVMCLCFGISGILALIDFIKILSDNYVVDPEKLV